MEDISLQVDPEAYSQRLKSRVNEICEKLLDEKKRTLVDATEARFMTAVLEELELLDQPLLPDLASLVDARLSNEVGSRLYAKWNELSESDVLHSVHDELRKDVFADEITKILEPIEGAQTRKVRVCLDQSSDRKGIQFFKVRFEPNEVVMPKGVYSDYVAIHVDGVVRVFDSEQPKGLEARLACWKKPRRPFPSLVRWAEKRLPNPPLVDEELNFTEKRKYPKWQTKLASVFLGRFVHRSFNEQELSKPMAGKANLEDMEEIGEVTIEKDAPTFIGLTSVLWNQPRSVTLVAGPKGCTLILMKRYAIVEVVLPAKSCQAFYVERFKEFIQYTLPKVLLNNRLFYETLHRDEIDNWESFWKQIVSGKEDCLRRLREQIEAHSGKSLESVADGETARTWLVSEINSAFKRALTDGDDHAADELGERIARNRRALEDACGGVVRHSKQIPRSEEDAQWIVDCILRYNVSAKDPVFPTKWESGQVVYRAGDPADAVFLILNGRFRVSRVAGTGFGSMVVNFLERNGYFGENCLEENFVRRATVEAATIGYTLRIPRELFLEILARYTGLRDRIVSENHRIATRDRDIESGRRVPPKEPPEHLVEHYLRASNVLLIDMDRCTRCDQCVQACSEAHDDRPRFHRSNPQGRFGKWEIAGACVHCIDAPCQQICPVGAITFVESGAVQVHRDRCIGCRQCVDACPYGSIDMYPHVTEAETPAENPKRPGVSTKCDLCVTDTYDPPCVIACPYDAAHRGPLESFFPGIRGWAEFAIGASNGVQ